MNADRYARVRDLFFAADELSGPARQNFLENEIGDDKELMAEVLSLLGEHDAEHAQREGAKALPVPAPRELGQPVDVLEDAVEKAEPRRAAEATKVPSTSELTYPPRKKLSRKKSSRTKPSQPDPLDTKRGEKKVSASEITQRGAERTHASPKDFESRGSKDRTSPSELLLASKSRRARRINSGWLWLAAVLPTLVVGYLTYHSVSDSVQLALRNELTGVSNSVELATGRFLDDKAQLVQSWARQSLIRDSILGLVELSDRKSKLDVAESSPLAAQILSELKVLSGKPDVKFVVWNQSFTTIASWREDHSDLGQPVIPSGTSDVARVLRGETVVYGPDRGDGPASLTEVEVGTADESIEPMMACIVPIRDENSEVVAALLVNSIGLFKEFNELFHESSVTSGLDIYAINRDGKMISVSPHAASLFHRSQFDMDPDTIVASLRVSDPGAVITDSIRDQLVRRSLPLTESASSATLGESLVRLDPYSNYARR
ncbi:two-component sensor histidine kinase, partial [Rhodopirellula maiorica SM1]